MEIDIAKAQTVFKILGEKNRIEVVQLLSKKDRRAIELSELTDVRFVNISKHLDYLRKFGFVSAYKKGLHTYYHLENNILSGLIKYVLSGTLFQKRSS